MVKRRGICFFAFVLWVREKVDRVVSWESALTFGEETKGAIRVLLFL